MRVEIRIDGSCSEPKVVIFTASITEEVNDILNQLQAPQILSGIRDGKLEVIEQADLIRIYAGSGKVFAVTHKGEYALRLRLYEVEERLPPHCFVRISKSEIINLKKVDHFDMSFTGTICVRLSDGTLTYVSRRCISKLKTLLGI